ncbi:MAG: M1 family metallopeptidase [Chloroflexota bacterium]
MKAGRSSSRACLLLLTVALVAVAVVGPSPATRAQAAAPTPAATYHLDAAVDLASATVTVAETVQLRNVVGVPLGSLVFRAVPNTLGLFALASAAVDGQAVSPKLDGSVLELPLTQPLAPSATTVVDLRYSLDVPRDPGRLTASPRAMALGYWFPMLAVHHGDWDRRQFVDVGDATFGEVADFDLTVTTSEPAHVVATGQRVEQVGNRSRFQASSVRDVAVSISPDFVVKRVTVGGSTLEVAAFGEDRAAFYLSRGAEFLKWAGDRLRPYPYPVLTVVDAELPASYGGLEYPGLIFISRVYRVSDHPEGESIDSLYLHEVLHQWFYALVGNDQIADPWLDEAFVTYLTYAYYRESLPRAAPSVYERTIAGGGTGAIDTTVYDYPSDAPYFGVVYRRGARFLEALQSKLGDGPFWALLRDYVDTFRDRIATPRAFLDRAQGATQSSLAPLISDYFTYGAFRTPTPRNWTLDAPTGPWVGSASLFVAADFPVTRVQVWLDQRKMADGPANAVTLDLTGVEPGSYVLLVQVCDHDDVLFERARRVEIGT